MINFGPLIFGPLAGPECRRSVARGWLILVRTLAALAALAVTLFAVWWWWIAQKTNSGHLPFDELRTGLALVEWILLTIALVLGPAVLAGSLAGEKERGALGLLMTTRVSSREIVVGRLVGKLGQVAMILLACVPALAWLLALVGVRPHIQVVFALLPAAVAFGGGGLAVLSSVLSRRGRDALLSVYLIDLFLLMGPLSSTFGLPPGVFDWLAALNPYSGVSPLAWNEDVSRPMATIGLWTMIGLAGVAVASWRLRPSCLAQTGGDKGLRRGSRQAWVPPVDERRPMVWKELFIERVGTLGRFGKWVGALLVAVLGGGSLVLAALLTWDVMVRHGYTWADWSREQFAVFVGQTGFFVCCLIQWAIGLRAGVTISSERERGTWDALLTSPLSGREIVVAKLWGSLYAIRWLILSAFLAWTLDAATGAIKVAEAVQWGAEVLVIGAFMAAVGVRTSLVCQTATRAMTLTIGFWLGAFIAVGVVAAIAIAVAFLVCNAAWILLAQMGIAPPIATFWTPVPMRIAWPVSRMIVYLLATFFIVLDTGLRFDRIAGRMTEGKVALAFDDLIYGAPVKSFPTDSENGEPAPVEDELRQDVAAG